MKKTWFILLLMLTVAIALPALAQTTAVDVNGKTYVFSAENGTYAVDGITFRVEDGQISAMLPDGTFVGATHGETEYADAVESPGAPVPRESAVESASGDSVAAGGDTSQEGLPWTAAEKEAFCLPYAAFGLAYDADRDALVYQGKTVREFLDVQKSNGEALESGKFTGTISNFYNASGEIDVETIRDSTDLDENGVGRLLGLRVVNAA